MVKRTVITRESLVNTVETGKRLQGFGIQSIFSWHSFKDKYGEGWAIEETGPGSIPALTVGESLRILCFDDMTLFRKICLVLDTGMDPDKLALKVVKELQP